MNDFARYYIYTALLFLTLGIADIIFSMKFANCIYISKIGPFIGNVTTMYIYLITINFVLALMIFLQGIIVNYFSSLDSDELRAMGWCKKILGIICRTLPLIIKLFHFLKLVLVLITSYTTYFEAVPDKPDVAAVNSTIANCNNANFSTTVKLEYNSQKIIYQTVECATTFFTLSCLCICRTFFDITTFCYDPIDKNASGWKKLMKTLGP